MPQEKRPVVFDDLDILDIFAEDRSVITYRPRWNQLTGSLTATILLQQMLYWWYKSGRKPFYKFFAPCKHRAYREGDSWQEELGFTKHELETAIKKIAKKVTTGVSKTEALKNHLVIYWTDRNRMTWYQVNEEFLRQKLVALYSAENADFLYNAGNRNYIEKDEKRNYQDNPGNLNYQESSISGNTCTETTTETNNIINGNNDSTKQKILNLLAQYGVRRTKKVQRLASLYTIDQVERVIEAARMSKLENPQGLVVSMLESGDIPTEVKKEPQERYQNLSTCPVCNIDFLNYTLCRDCGCCESCCTCEPPDPVLMENERIWEIVKQDLSLQMDRATFSRWIKKTSLLKRDDKCWQIGVENAQVQEWLTYRLRNTIERTIRQLFKETVETEFVIDEHVGYNPTKLL